MKKYGVMIVGTGWVSGEHIRAFEMTEEAQVTAIVSRSRGLSHRGFANPL